MTDPLSASASASATGVGPPSPVAGEGAGVERGMLATVNSRLIRWDANNIPVPTSVPVLTKSQVEDLALTVASLPFEDPLGVYPEFAGMTNMEVMWIRRARKAAMGNDHAMDTLLDRILGRPKQSSEVKSFSMTYEDKLKEIARLEQTDAQRARPADPWDYLADPLSDISNVFEPAEGDIL